MNRLLILLLMILVPTMNASICSSATSPLETIQGAVLQVLEVLRDPALKTDAAKATREKKVWAIIDGVFDYTELSKRTLAQHWRDFGPRQQQEFIRLFGKLLGSVYMGRIMGYRNEKVVFTRQSKLSESLFEVQSNIVTADKSIPVHYRMISRDGSWNVYDVAIEGVSLVQNYRAQFRDILAKKPPEGLLEMLREKVEKK